MNQAKLDEAWEIFNKAADLEHRTLNKPEATENARRMAVKNADRKLDKAVELERQAFEDKP